VSKVLSALVIAGLALSLVACSSGGADSSCAATPSGSTSDAVKVSGKFDVAPTVSAKKGLKVTKTERSVVIEGKGDVVAKGDTATIAITAYNATTGKKLSADGYSKGTETVVPVDAKKVIPGLAKGIQCSTVGSRIVTAMTPADGFRDQGTDMGVGAKDTLVLVVDILKSERVPTKANGTSQAPKAGFPKVVLGKDGAPTLTIPKTDPPATFTSEVLKKGSGKKVAKGDTVTVQYLGEIWATGKTFDSSWSRGVSASFPTTGVIPGFSKALVGQTVGSQVVAIIPPADGYVGGNADAGISATDTLVFVVDILATS
jgi:FKBP-type peptidyl-prolyl cis-trans isomerase